MGSLHGISSFRWTASVWHMPWSRLWRMAFCRNLHSTGKLGDQQEERLKSITEIFIQERNDGFKTSLEYYFFLKCASVCSSLVLVKWHHASRRRIRPKWKHGVATGTPLPLLGYLGVLWDICELMESFLNGNENSQQPGKAQRHIWHIFPGNHLLPFKICGEKKQENKNGISTAVSWIF